MQQIPVGFKLAGLALMVYELTLGCSWPHLLCSNTTIKFSFDCAAEYSDFTHQHVQ